MRFRSLEERQSGQGMTEYIIMVALIAIAAIGVITIFGQNLRALFATSANALGGAEITDIVKSGGGIQSTAERKNVSNFGSNASAGVGPGGGGTNSATPK